MHRAVEYGFAKDAKEAHAVYSHFAWFLAMSSNHAWLVSARDLFAGRWMSPDCSDGLLCLLNKDEG